MRSVAEDVITFYRMFSSLEREEICCGTVSPAQCVLLQTLAKEEWDVSSLAGHTRVTKGAMTKLVDGLEKRGWVKRKRDEKDARRVLISLTAGGKKEAKRLRCLTDQGIAKILDAIPESERPEVIHSIHLLAEAAERTRNQLDCC
jgi:DNA-binding MarR family transcriptional regulator